MSSGVPESSSRVAVSVDWHAQGVQHGHLIAPHSRNESPWGSLLIPVSVFRNGDGPTVLLTGGNHGDEYEGPVTLLKLIRGLELEQMRGTVIVIPALNYPAVEAGTRLSPVDGKNMNRIFPGRADGTLTEVIADYLQRFLLPLCDVVLDMHSGGRVMSFTPTTVIHELADAGRMARTRAAAAAFAAPYCLVLRELDSVGMLDSAVEGMGRLFISTELGGAGATTVETLRIAGNGVHDLLVHLGVLQGDPVGTGSTRFVHAPEEAYVMAERGGLFEIVVEPGTEVEAGAVLGRIHDLERPTDDPLDCRARIGGVVMHRHWSGHVSRGDCVSVIARDWGR